MKNLFHIELNHNLIEKMCEWRHFLHSHPEIGLNEKVTSEYIYKVLKEEAKIDEIYLGYAKTAVVAVIEGNSKNKNSTKQKTIALRADMDALPLKEKASPLDKKGMPYKSIYENTMHACAHDIHMASLLGAAKYLNEHKNFFGKVVFIFQPGEEGFYGAKLMIEEGLLSKISIDAIFALHIWPDLPYGEWGITEGSAMANSDMFTIKIKGYGGHGAFPHKTKDPIITASHLILALQNIISRMNDPLSPAVLSITQIHSGTTHNIIPEDVTITGTLRTLSTETQNKLIEKINQIINGVANTFDSKIELDFHYGYPAMINTPKETNFCLELVSELFPDKKIHYPLAASLGGEDFAYFLQKIPGHMIKLGVGGEFALHNPYFVPTDEIMSIVAKYWIGLVEKYN
ncbi:MAG: amidohydrolase [Oligoflexia bacterium]|nr:amidohydrolase [Oligoflexia bacterium]